MGATSIKATSILVRNSVSEEIFMGFLFEKYERVLGGPENFNVSLIS
jgi:hypothetical protein